MFKKSILFLTPRYWPVNDGTAVHMSAFAERFARDGYKVTVVTANSEKIEGFLNPKNCKKFMEEEENKGVKIIRVPVSHLPFNHIFLMNWLEKLPGEKNKILFGPPHAYLPEFLKKVLKIKERFSLIFSGVLPYKIFFYAAKKIKERDKAILFGLPLIHLGEPARPELKNFYFKEIHLKLISFCDYLLLNTEKELKPLINLGFEREKLVIAGCGIDPEKLSGGDGKIIREKFFLKGPIVFFIGTQTHDKGCHHLVEAMKIVWQKMPEIHLILAGELRPDFEQYLKKQPQEIIRKIINLGIISEEEKKNLLDAGDLLVVPSRADSFGIVYLEAWFYGKPVIGCYAGGVDEVIEEGCDGFLVPFGDSKMLSEYILKLVCDKELARKFGSYGKNKVLVKYTWEKVYQLVKKIAENNLKKYF